MRPLVITSSLTHEIHLQIQNITVTGFKQNSPAYAKKLGGAFSFTRLASGLIQHLSCSDNSEFSAGCIAFIGGENIFIEDSQ